jgi:uncharacterized membrane protein YdbT with pleckstrin-like domain
MNVKIRALIDVITLAIAFALAVYFYMLAPFDVFIILMISGVIGFFYFAYRIRVDQLRDRERKDD